MIEEFDKVEIHKLVHEIKNPLSICTGYLEMLPKANEENTSKYLNIIKNELQKCIHIISGINNKNNLNKTTFKLKWLLEEIEMTLKDLFDRNNVKLLIAKNNIELNADYKKLRQAFINILKNSLEAKDKRNLLISIKAFCNKGYCKIYITDNGRGMNSKEIAEIFTPYYTNKKNGTGLGTINIKDIIELHNGTIEYLSMPNKGTTAIIKLPIINNSN